MPLHSSPQITYDHAHENQKLTCTLQGTKLIRKSLVLENLCDGDWAEGVSFVGQIAADVVDREVFFAKGNDAVAYRIGLGCGPRFLGRFEEKVASGVLAELVDENSKAPGGVPEAMSASALGSRSTKKAWSSY
jgi:hypothetical protein